MSLHARLSPEALVKLRIQKRTSTILSLILSALSLLLILLVLWGLLLPTMLKESETITVISRKPVEDPPIDDPKPRNTPSKTPSSPSHAMSNVLLANLTSPVSVPVPEVEIMTPSTDYGNDDDFGDYGKDNGPDGEDVTRIPPELQKRCSKQDRLQRLAATGGTPACEDAVEKGLEWIKATQSSDGSWGNSNKPAMTGFALLAYLGRCETPRSEKYGESCLRAIVYLVDLGMKQNGSLAANFASQSGPYEHAIATYAIAEAATFCKQFDIAIPNLPEVTRMAGQLIIDNQNENGGWAYSYAKGAGAHTDLSVVAWQLQALKACLHSGLEFSNLTRSANRGLEYVAKLQNAKGGFGYNSPNSQHAGGYFSLTGAGVLSLQMWGKGNHAAVRQGARYIETESEFDYNNETADLYGHYYEAQAMLNRGGRQWDKYNEMLRDQLLANQNPDGSWKAPGGGNKVRAAGAQYVDNTHYRNCLNILMLEVYYRFLPGTGAWMN